MRFILLGSGSISDRLLVEFRSISGLFFVQILIKFWPLPGETTFVGWCVFYLLLHWFVALLVHCFALLLIFDNDE